MQTLNSSHYDLKALLNMFGTYLDHSCRCTLLWSVIQPIFLQQQSVVRNIDLGVEIPSFIISCKWKWLFPKAPWLTVNLSSCSSLESSFLSSEALRISKWSFLINFISWLHSKIVNPSRIDFVAPWSQPTIRWLKTKSRQESMTKMAIEEELLAYVWKMTIGKR